MAGPAAGAVTAPGAGTLPPAAGAAAPALDSGPLDNAALAALIPRLAGIDLEVPDDVLVDQLRLLEEGKAAMAAAQARAAARFDASQRAVQAAAGVRAADLGKGIAAQVGLARRESPVRGGQHLGLAKALVFEMPHTMAALTAGRLSEWRATLLVRETACLSVEHRAMVDRALAGAPGKLDGLGDAGLVAEARKLAYQLDPHAVLNRARKAETERRVTCRPAPDTMAHLTALLPVKQAVAAYAALLKDADSARAAGDPRTRGQVMADTLVARLTGQATADRVPLAIELVITDRTLLAGGTEPAHLPGYGPVPAPLARSWVTLDPDVAIWLRRLYTHPGTGDLIAMDARTRAFTGNLRRFVELRDHTCRTPWCDAPIRHTDHPQPYANGGATSTVNAQGLCEACNYTQQAPGWPARPAPPPGPPPTPPPHPPTGHSYHSTAPPLPGHRPPPWWLTGTDTTTPSPLATHFANLHRTA